VQCYQWICVATACSQGKLADSFTETTSGVAAGFGRHGMTPPAANDTGTALGQDGSD